MSATKCEECTKTVYPLEAYSACGKSWHKICYKCFECKQVLNLKTAQPHQASGAIYCATHYPKEKATAIADSLSMKNATNAPKLATVNNQKRGDGMESNHQSADTMSLNNAKNAPKVERLPPHLREDQHVKPIGTLDMAHINAMNAPKVERLPPHLREDQHVKPIGTLDMAHMNAMNAPKVNTVNDQIRGAGDAPSQDIDLKLQNALNAPKVNTVNDQIRGHGDAPSQDIDLKLQNALNAPKLDVYNNEVKAIDRNI
ncbi:hypothetical protein CYY_010453 [Polysphondylium violaceum]|uniref:LIM zinc-binding domain-containing protein n=1 Tax=Polysphondylium violaceum TaxID=133409 RepID=A0A8J4PK43_9MYCE|nr:hypothetical protein CYY_010453 [Polysphondylium violaceum]